MSHGKPASISGTSFNCPHCGTYTSQKWSRIYLNALKPNEVPDVLKADVIPNLDLIFNDAAGPDTEQYRRMRRLAEGAVFPAIKQSMTLSLSLENVWVSQCYTCSLVALWRHERLMYPTEALGEEANPDMPTDVKADYEEARTILNLSPRGAAALLRLAIQKLCVHLEEPGKHINTDIGSLVAKGLPIQIANALDIVRVIGNDAVHPGELDLRDDRDTVFGLLRIINLVIENRISQPKHLNEMYSMLSPDKTAAIEERNAKAIQKLASEQDKKI